MNEQQFSKEASRKHGYWLMFLLFLFCFRVGAQLLWFGLRECYARLLLLLIRGMKHAARALSLPLPKRYLRVILLRFL